MNRRKSEAERGTRYIERTKSVYLGMLRYEKEIADKGNNPEVRAPTRSQ
jgi:hypothetical protein